MWKLSGRQRFKTNCGSYRSYCQEFDKIYLHGMSPKNDRKTI